MTSRLMSLYSRRVRVPVLAWRAAGSPRHSRPRLPLWGPAVWHLVRLFVWLWRVRLRLRGRRTYFVSLAQ